MSTIPNHPKDGAKGCNFVSRRFMNSNVNYIKKIAFNNGNFMRLVLFCLKKNYCTIIIMNNPLFIKLILYLCKYMFMFFFPIILNLCRLMLGALEIFKNSLKLP
jgi:hypothetical protein